MKKNTEDYIYNLPNQPVWYEKKTPQPSLKQQKKSDVVIIGAGYTGLWTAYYLLSYQPDLKVTIVEKEHVGFGASGRNGGWVSAVFPISLAKLAELSSRDAALKMQVEMNNTVDVIGKMLQDNHIEANYSKQGLLNVARSEAQLQRAHRQINELEDFGLESQWFYLNQSETAQRINIANSLGAVYTPHCAVVHPGMLVRGLAEKIMDMGAALYEQSPVTKIEKGYVETPEGRVTAPVIVRATESYSCQFKQYKRTVIPLYSLVLATEPLPKSIIDSCTLNHRMAFNDLRHLRVYAQMTTDNRLVFGGRGAPYYFGSKISPSYDLVDNIHVKIKRTMVDFFPALSEVKVTHRWGGPLAVSRDWCPSVSFDRSTGIAWAGQYVGDGVATSNLAGRILRSLILDIDDDLNYLPIVNRTPRLWEPEPFRWLGVNLGLSAVSYADIEERLTNHPSFLASAFGKITGAH